MKTPRRYLLVSVGLLCLVLLPFAGSGCTNPINKTGEFLEDPLAGLPPEEASALLAPYLYPDSEVRSEASTYPIYTGGELSGEATTQHYAAPASSAAVRAYYLSRGFTDAAGESVFTTLMLTTPEGGVVTVEYTEDMVKQGYTAIILTLTGAAPAQP